MKICDSENGLGVAGGSEGRVYNAAQQIRLSPLGVRLVWSVKGRVWTRDG